MSSQTTSNSYSDNPGLGEHPHLKPMDRRYVRQALSMLEVTNSRDIELAARFLISRIREYYAVIGYVGPLVTKTNCECGRAFGAWIVEPHCQPWRECFITTNPGSWKSLGQLFLRIRFADFECALRLAAWEASQEVPESAASLNKAIWVAYRFINASVSKPWSKIRNRNGTHSMRQELDAVLGKIAQLQVPTTGRAFSLAS